MDELFTTRETARLLKVNVQTVRRWLCAGKLPGRKLNDRDWRVSRTELEAWMDQARLIPAKEGL